VAAWESERKKDREGRRSLQAKVLGVLPSPGTGGGGRVLKQGKLTDLENLGKGKSGSFLGGKGKKGNGDNMHKISHKNSEEKKKKHAREFKRRGRKIRARKKGRGGRSAGRK